MKTPTIQPLSLPVRLTRSLRTPFWKKTVSSILLAQFALWSVQVKGADVNWTGSLPGNWDTVTSNWSTGTWNNAAFDTAIFGTPSGAVTLTGPITAGGLTFNANGWSIGGAAQTLTLQPATGFAAPLITVNNTGSGTNAAIISAILAGSSGFAKLGDGSLRLTNSSNSFTGDLSIRSGSLIVDSVGALGAGTTAISVTGLANTGAPGYSGGSLVLNGATTPMTINREVTVSGRGPGAANSSGGVVSVGYNTFAGGLTLGSAASEGRAIATHGNTSVSGTLYLGSGGTNTLGGNGNWIVSGRVAGNDNSTDRFLKSGNTIASTLWLQNNSNNFLQTMRIDSGTVRVSAPGALGISTVTTGAVGSVDLNGAGSTQGLEIRSDSTNWSGIGFRIRGNSNGVILDHSIGNYGANSLNQTLTFGNVTFDANSTFQANGRNGFNSSFTGSSGTVAWTNGNPMTWNNASNGTMTINANISRATETTARALTITASGETILTGNILEPTQGTGSITLTKAGSGPLTIQGTAGTYTGPTNVNAGTLNISAIGALNDNSNAVSVGRVVFGGGTLNYTGSGETWTNKILLLNTTNSILTNNGTGALVLPRNVGNNGTGLKNLVLGGANTGTNDLQGIVVNTNAGAGVTKYDSGLWQISSPGTTSATIGTANNAFAATALTAAGQTITTTSTSGLVVGQPVSGGTIPAGTVISQIISSTQFAISQSTVTPASLNIGTVTGATATLTTSAASGGTTTAPTLTFASTANLVVGQQVTNAALTGNWYISAITSGTVVTLSSTTGNTLAVGGIASGQSIVPASSPNFAGPLTITGGTVQLNPLAAAAAAPVLSGLTNVVFGADTIRNNGFAGGTLNYKAFSTGSTQTAGILSVTAGAGLVQITPTAGTNTLTFGSMVVPASGTSLNLAVPASPGTNSIAFTTGNTLVNGIVGARAYFNGGDFLGGTTTAAAPSYTTFAGGAALATLNTTPYLVTGDVTAQTSATINAGIKFASARALTLASGQTLTLQNGAATVSGGILQTGGFSSTISGGTGITSGGAAELVFRTDTASDTLTLSTPILVGTTGGFSKNGAGTLILNAVNAGAASTVNVNEGTLRLLGDTTTLGATNMNVTLRQGTTFDVNGVNVSAAPVVSGTATRPLNALVGAGTVTNGAVGTTSTIAIGSGNTAGIFSGLIQDGTGKISLTKTGTATQTLTGLNTFTGPLTFTGTGTSTIAATTLANIGVASSIGRGDNTSTATNQASIVFASGANTILYTGASTSVFQTTQTPSVSIDRLFTIAGGATGTLDSSGQFGNNTAAASTANSATLVFNNTNPIAYTGTGTATLGLAGSSIGDNRFVPLLNNSNFAVTKSGAGLWILDPTSSNTYSGATSITGGALQVAPQGAAIQGLPSTSNLVLNGGVLQTSGNFAMNLGTGAGQVQFTGNGGFSASTSKLTVNLSSNTTLNLGTTPTTGSTLILSSTTALADVELTNPINLGTAARTIQVDDNGTTNLDFATVSGVISGGAGGTLTKSSGGTLILGNANTYTANTILNNGSLIVTSLGNATGTTSSSIGASGGTLNWNGDVSPNLVYVGTGEASTRPITFTPVMTAARTYSIDSSGSGPLSLSSITNSQTGAFALTLQLRGTNTDNNVITSVLANGANTLNLTKSDGGVWSLNPSAANTFTGTINANGGLLGLTTNGIGTAASITFNNGGIFAYGGPLVTSTPVVQANNSTNLFAGTNSITLNGTFTKSAGTNDQTFSNNIQSPGILTINGNYVNAENPTAVSTRIINYRGYGSTVWNGAIVDNSNVATSSGASGSRTNLNIAIDPTATFTLGGAGVNTYTGGTTLTDGILILDKTGALGAAANGGTATFTFSGGTLRAGSTITDLAGVRAISNPVVIGNSPPKVDGSKSIEFSGGVALGGSRSLQNELTGGATLTISGTGITNTAASTLTLFGAGNTSLTGPYAAGTGANGLTMSGTGTLTSTGTNLASGTLTANRGTIVLSGTAGGSWNAGTTAVNPGGTLTLDNSGGNNSAGRLFDTGAFTGGGGTLNIISNGTASTETTGVLTLNQVQTKVTMSGAGTNSLTFASVTFANTGSSLDLSSISNLGAANKVIFTAAPTLTNNINTRIFVNGGADFATHTANGVEALASGSYNSGNNLNTALAADTMNLTASAATTANRTVNAIKINGTGLNVSGAASNRLTLGAAGIINTGGDNTLSVNEVAFAANIGVVQVASGTTLTLNSGFTGSGALVKALGGTLTFGSGVRSYVTSTQNILDGTVNLNGGADTLFPNQALTLNLGATVNLNGGGQYVANFTSPGALPNSGGTITGGGALVTSGTGVFAGVIAGASTNFARVANNGSTTFETAQTYGGVTSIMGNTLTLENDATLLNTSVININGGNATLSVSNNSSLQTQINNRIGDSIALNLRGGTISVTGRLSTAATETLGAVSSLQGANTITATTGGGTITSMDLTLASLTRSAGTTVNFTGTGLGQQGNNARINFATPLTTVGNGILGAWAIANTNDYAAYNTGTGIGIVGQGGYAGYDATFASGNYTEITGTAAVTTNLTGSTTTALLRLAGGFNNDITFTNASDSLNLELGGILRSNNNNNSTIGTVAIPGVITSGVSELVVYNNQGTTTINSQITGATRLVKSGGGILSLSNLTNNYSLGTTVSQGTINLNGGATANGTTSVIIPAGGLTLTNSTVTMVTNPGQIAASNAVTLNGGSTLTLVGANTLASLAFDNNGGTATPTVTTGGLLTLTGATPITVASSNPAFIPTIAGSLDLGTGSKTINTPAIQLGGVTVTNLTPTLSITAPILSPGVAVTKTGNGVLLLSGASTFGGGLNVTGGAIVVGAGSTPTTGVITSGPLGTGAVAMSANTTMLANSSSSIANPVSFASTPTFDATANTAWTLTLNGALSGAGLPGGTLTANVANPGLTVALLGNMPAFSSVVKNGLGTLIFNATNYTGDFNATALGNAAAVSLLADGNGTGQVQTLLTGSNVIFDAGIVPNITVGRAGGFGGSSPYILSANKVIAPASISNLGLGLTLTNGAGDGLRASDSFTTTATPTYTVGTATGSNVIQGLEFTGTITAAAGFNKAGAGTLILGNSGNSISAPINVTQGVLSVSSLAQLGGAQINLNPSTGTSTLRVTGNITGSPAIQFTTASNTRAIEVSAGNTFQLDSAFDVSLAAAAGLTKADNGTLAINANNSAWNGVLTISQGAVNVLNAGALGTTVGNTVVGASGAALLLPAGTSIAEPLSLTGSGIQSAGALRGTGAGTSTETGAITLAGATFIGADSGNTLSLTGGISGAQALTFVGAGNISLTSTALGAVSSVTKIGSGTTTLGVASTGFVGGLTVNNGTFVLGSAGAGSLGITGTITVNPTGTFTVDNTTGAVARLGNRPVTLAGGTFNYNTNSGSAFTETDTSALTFNQGGSSLNLNNAGGSLSTLTFGSLGTFGGGSTANINGLNIATSQLKFTTAPTLVPATTGILARLIVGGNEFATYSTANGIVPFSGYAAASNILSVTPTQTFKATPSTLNSLGGSQTINALTLDNINSTVAVGGIGGNPPVTLTIASGAILAKSSGTGTQSYLNVPIIAFGAEGLIHVQSGQTLDVTSAMTGTSGLTKALNGTLNLNAQQFVSGSTIINGGTVNLSSTVTNTLLFNNAVAVNAGGTLNLNGSSQFIAGLSTQAGGAGTDLGGGTVTNTGSLSTLTVNGNTNFGGVITGAINLNKTGTGALNLQAAQTYTGSTLITGGTVSLNDSATLPNTSQPIEIRHGSLSIGDANLISATNRVSDTAPITLVGGTIAFAGRAQTASSETLGSVTLVGGHSTFTTSTGGTGINSLDVTIASLARSDATSTIRFNAGGQIGSAARLMITSAPTLTNNIIGAWAVSDRDFASYDSTYGVGRLNDTGFANYSTVGITNSPTASDNVRFNAAGTTTLAGNTTVNTLTFGQQTAATVLNLGGNTLTIAGGGLLFGQNSDNVDFSITNGSITSGVLNSPSDFFIHHGNFGGTNRTATIAAPIVDNGTGAVRVIYASGAIEASGVGNTNLTGISTYTGGTIINSGNIVIGAGGALGTGGITVNNGFLTQSVAATGIPSQALTLNGGGVVTLAGNNSLTNLTFNNNGGAQPTLNPTGILTLTGATGITASVTSPGTISTIAGGTIDFNANASYPISVGAAIINSVDVAPWQAGLNITSTIQNGGIVKSGAGLLGLSSGLSTFTGGVNITAGGLVLGASSTPNTFSGTSGVPTTVTSGPVGTGLLTLANNTTVVATTPVILSNDVTFTDDGFGVGNNVFNGTNNITFNGITTLPATWNVSVTAPQTTVTIADVFNSIATDVTNKSGPGTLVLNNYLGSLVVAGGLTFTADGNGLGTQQSINLGGNVTLTGDTSVLVKNGSSPNARNKIIQQGNLVNNGSILNITPQNGFGLEFTGTTSFTGASTISVGAATASNVVQGLTLSGVVSDTGGYTLVKSGPGTLALTNSGNTFGGAGATIDVLNGILSVSNDGALGNAANTVTLEVDGSSGLGFRAAGSFSTNRTFSLLAGNNAIEVTPGNLFTVNSPFSLGATTNTLTKNDNGILEIAADNSTWNSTVTVAGGVLQLSNSSALGSSILATSGAGQAAVYLSGGVNISNALNLTTVAGGATGINSTGALFSASGVNTYSGLITQPTGVGANYGAANGATLNINGNIAAVNSPTFNTVGTGIINLNSVYGNGGVGGPSFNKIGTGTLNVTVNQSAVTSAVNVNQGTMNVSGSGVTLGITGTITVGSAATLNISDASGAASSHFGNRPLTITGGNFSYTGNSANSSETNTGALTFNRGGSIYTSNQSGSGTVSLTFASLGLGSDASANFTGTNLGTATNKLLFTTAPTLIPATTGILPRASVNGSSFATYGANGITAFSAYNATSTTNINSAGATDTVDANAAMTTKNLTATKTINALRLSGGAAQTVGGAAFSQLVLTSGGILATGATTHQLTVPVLNNAAVQTIFLVDSGSTLNVSSVLLGTAGMVKDGDGTLVLASPANIAGLAGVNSNTFSGTVNISRGTLRLNGGTNTMLPGVALALAGPAATLDLNGTSQVVGAFLTDSSTPNTGGSIIGNAGSQLVINLSATDRSFTGSIGGSVNLVRSGPNTVTFYSPNTTTGTAIINGGTTSLQSDGNLSGITALDINFATLSADNNTGLSDNANRINDAAAITLRGGTLTVQGRAQAVSSEALGTVSAVQGFNVINPLVGGTGVNSVDVSLASLSRPVGSAATLLVQGTNLGTIGSNSRVTVGTLNGVTTTNPTYSANGSGLTNNLVGGWAINGSDFLTYIPGLGLAPLNQTGAAQYDLTNTFVGGTGTKNVRLTATTSVPNGGSLVNAVSMTGATINIAFATGTDTLNIVSGGLIGPNNNQSIGATVDSGRITAGGLTPAASSDLYVFNRANTLTINSRITDNSNGSTSSVRAVFTASGGAITLPNVNNSYTGGTVVNGGTLNLLASTTGITIPLASTPANGLILNNATVTMGGSTNTVSGQIAAGNVVTLNGVSTLNLFGNNTLAGLVFNNIGGGSGNAQINTFSTATAAGTGSTGILSIGNSGITVTSSNVSSTALILGLADFGATAKTIDVAPINVNGVDVAPLQAAFALYGITGTTGGITKSGNGVLQFNAQAQYTGPTTINAGGIRTGVTFGGSRYSALTLNSGTYLNLSGATTTWGSLAGSGSVLNSSTTNATLNVGYDNTSTTFSGQFQRFNDAALGGVAIQKIGTGTLSLTSAQSFATGTTGTITVNGGGLTYSGAGAAFPATTVSGGATITVNNGGKLTLNNVDSNVNNRLGMNLAGTFNIQGGTLAVAGNSGANTTETITTFNITNGGGRIEFTPNASTSTGLTITTLSGANGNGSLVVGGIDGSAAGTVNKATLTITTPALITGQGAGANGSTTMAVRHDILGDSSVSGLGTGFLVRDSVGLTYRALASSELASAFALPLTTDVDLVTAGNQAAGTLNVGLSSAATIGVNTVANTLTFSGTSSVSSNLGTPFGVYGPGGNLLTTSLSNAAASLTLAGATATINTAFGSTTAGTTPFVHVIAGGTLNVNGAFAVNGTVGLAKADGGTLNLNNKAYYTGTTSVNNGTLNLNSGSANTIAVVPTAGGATVSRLDLNGSSATVDLKGQNQAVGQIVSVNPLPGLGGTITNSGALAIFTNSSQAGSSTFGGQITGAIAFNRVGNNTTTLTSANTYTGATTIRGGTLQLRDSGSISNTAGLTLNYGTLNWDNFGLNPNGTPNPTRIVAGNPVTLQGGTFTINGAGSTDTVVTLNSVTVTGGANTINTLPYINEGSTVKLTISNLIRNTSNRSGVNFNGFTTNNSTGSNTLGGQGLNTNSNIILSQVNGANFSSSNLVNNLIGGWAVADGSTFATYDNTFGVVAMGNTYGGFSAPAFTGTDITSTVVTGNYNDAGTGTTAITRTMTTGAKTANSWRIAQSGAATTVTPVAGTTYSFGVGIITNNNQTVTIGAVDTSNTLTGTGTDLFMYINSGTTIVQPSIIGSAALVSNGPGTLRIAPAFASNTYSGGTFINGGTTNLQAATGLVAIPGALTINNATVTLGNATANQIATTSAVTINGGGQLNLFNYTVATSQTLDSLTFNNEGGTAAPTFAFSNPTALSTITLSNANAITATNNNLALTPIIAAATTAANSALTFSNANPVITVNAGLAETGLNITAPITGTGGFTTLTKSGAGALALSGASTFATGFSLNQGSLIFGAGSTGTPVTSGPVGTGTLTIAGGTAVLSDGTARNIGNAVTVNGDFTFGGVIAGNNLTLSGAVNLGAAGRTITVTSPAVTSTISGAITSTATGTALTKAGAGTLILSSAANNFAGAAVAVTGGILKNGVDNALPTTSAVAVSAGAGYDLNNFNQTLDSISGAGFITQSAGNTRTLTISSTVTNSTFNSVITDNNLGVANSRLNLTKVGTPTTLTLGGANSYIGTTTVTSGILSITNALALGTTANGTVVSSGGSLELQNNITVTGEALSIAGTGSATNGALRNLSGNNTFAGLVTLTGDASIQSDAGSLTLDVATGNAITATTQNLTFTGAGNITVADAIAIGSGSLTKVGSGNLTLGASNTYSGKTFITNGTISVGSTAALGTNAALDLGVATTSSGRLLYTGSATTLSKNINVLGNGSDTIQNAGSGLLTLSGTLTKAGTTLNLVGGASGILVTGTIVGLPASSDLVIGNGTTTLQSANSYNGPTILNSGGTLNINHASAISNGAFTINGGTIDNTSGADITLSTNNPLNINSNFTFTGTNNLNLGTGAVTLDANRTVTVTANTLTIGGSISGSFSLTGTGAGTLLLTGASTYTGTTTAVTGSTISVGGNGSLGDTSSGTVIDSGASLALNNVLYTDAEPLNINGAGVGNGGAFRTTGVSSFAGTITASTNATINATGTLSLTGGLVKNGTTLTLGGSGTYNISGAGISGASANSDLVVDASIVNLGVASTYNGPTFIRNGGRINANVTDALPTSISRTALIMDDSGTGSSTLGLAVDQSVASLTGAASSQILLGANQLTVGASGSGSSTFAGSITGTGGSIVKDGTNTQIFSGANTYTGTTSLNAGVLNLGSAENVGTSGPLGASAASNPGSIVFGGGTLQYSASNQNDYSGRFSTAAGQAISIDTNGQNVSLATALISSGGSLNKQGAGTLTVTGANTFDAGTTVNGGTLLVNNTTGSGTGSGAVSVSNAGTVLGGNGTVAGNLTVNAGALIAPGSAANTAGTLTIGGSTVVIAGNGVAETRLNFDYTNATGNVPGLTPTTWSSYNGSLLTGNGGQSNDLLSFTASTTTLTWGTGGKISLNQIGSAYSWVQGDVFNLLDWTALGDGGNGAGSIGGSFNSAIDFNLPTLSGGLAWDTSRFVTTGAIAVVPEPGRALLMLFGLMALFFRRRRQD